MFFLSLFVCNRHKKCILPFWHVQKYYICGEDGKKLKRLTSVFSLVVVQFVIIASPGLKISLWVCQPFVKFAPKMYVRCSKRHTQKTRWDFFPRPMEQTEPNYTHTHSQRALKAFAWQYSAVCKDMPRFWKNRIKGRTHRVCLSFSAEKTTTAMYYLDMEKITMPLERSPSYDL